MIIVIKNLNDGDSDDGDDGDDGGDAGVVAERLLCILG